MSKRGWVNVNLLIAAAQLFICCLHASPLMSRTNEISGEKNDSKRSNAHVPRKSAKGSLSHKDVIRRGRVDPTQLHDVIFVIQQNNIEKLTEILDDISDPTSTNYGKHMTGAEIADLTGNPVARDEVVSYLLSAGASIVSETLYGEYITASAPVSVWEEVLDTEFFIYTVLPINRDHQDYNVEGDKSVKNYIRAEKYSVPIVLDTHVQSISNTIQLPPMTPGNPLPTVVPYAPSIYGRGHSVSVEATVVANGYIYPSFLNSYYNIDSNIGHPLATQALFAGYGQHFSPDDLATFQSENFLPNQPVSQSLGNHSVSSAWCMNNILSCSEGNLDTEYMMAVSQSPTTYYYTSLGLTSAWLVEIASLVNPPLVISISYGIEEHYVDPGEMDAFNIQAIKLSVMGVTIVSSSGDDGANSWIARLDPAKCQYQPIFPCTSPYVLSVGGTQVS